MNRFRRHAAVWLMLATFTLGGCATLAARNASPSVKFYAAVADYNTAKLAAVKYAEIPEVSASRVQEIVTVVELADAAIKGVVMKLAAGDATDSLLLNSAELLLSASRALRDVIGPAVDTAALMPALEVS